MKFCPSCKTGFPDHAERCPTHGGYLSEIIDLKAGMLIRSTYRIVRKLGEGGFGAVYLADQTLMDEPRALKFLSRQWSRDESFTARFRREVRTLRQVRHRNVVDCGDLERAEDDSLFFAMEYVDGPDLRDFLDKAPRPLDVGEALELTRGIAEGLGAAHAKGMVHRDIKPENVLLARENRSLIPKIADFGIVATKETSTMHTRAGGSLLTMAYAAPEQWRGAFAADLDGRTDFYALGGVLFEMLTGLTVFSAESYEGWALQHLNAAPASPSNLRPELADWHGLDALVAQLLAKDRNNRPKDVDELLRLLEAVRYVAPITRPQTVREGPVFVVRPTTVVESNNAKLVIQDAPLPEQSEVRRTGLRGGIRVMAGVAVGSSLVTAFAAAQEIKEFDGWQTIQSWWPLTFGIGYLLWSSIFLISFLLFFKRDASVRARLRKILRIASIFALLYPASLLLGEFYTFLQTGIHQTIQFWTTFVYALAILALLVSLIFERKKPVHIATILCAFTAAIALAAVVFDVSHHGMDWAGLILGAPETGFFVLASRYGWPSDA